MKKVIVGGTFDIIHKGHEFLLAKAFSLGDVTIGLTSDNFAERKKGKILNNFEERRENLKRTIFNKFQKEAKIIKIEDIFGPTLKEDFDFIVVSSETFENALRINKTRKKLKKKPIKISKIKMVLAEDGKPISCTRIRKGEIDKEGKKCLFCKIVEGKIRALKIYENKKFLAFLDKNPRNIGHTLVIPKEHFRWIWDIPYIDSFFKFAQKIANAIRKSMKTDWVISPILGDEIWHAHLHLIPRFKNDNFHYLPPSVKNISEKEMKKTRNKIKKSL